MARKTNIRANRNSHQAVSIDSHAPISFTFDGRTYQGCRGDTLASALLANNVHLTGRSFKYHRPRGIMAAGAEEPNALVGIGVGGRIEPNIKATQIELYDGLVAVSQNRFPSLKLDMVKLILSFRAFSQLAFITKPLCGQLASGWVMSISFAAPPDLARLATHIKTPTDMKNAMPISILLWLVAAWLG